MRTIYRIARVELSTLFFSPIAWFLMVIFFVQGSMAYVEKLESFVMRQESGRNLSNLTFKFFFDTSSGGIFATSVLQNLYLYIPLITMGLISREASSGTIKFLYSSPVRLSEIVLGKYLAMLVFNCCMILLLFIITLFGSFHIEALDWSFVFSSLGGFFLLLSAYAAIGLFVSCLSTYQVVAALGTFAIFALLKFVGTLWQQYDFLRELTNYLSISGRTESMIGGLINTRDVMYYLLITAMFLLFAWLKLNGSRRSVSWMKATINYMVVVLVVLGVGYLSSRPGFIGYFDATRTKMNTISINAQRILQETGSSPLEVTAYVNLLDNTYYAGSPAERQRDKVRWERYIRFKPDIRLNYVYYYDSTRNEYLYKRFPGMNLDELAGKQAKAYKIDLDRFKKPAEIRKLIDLYPEKNRLVFRLALNGKTTWLRTFNDNIFWPSEVEVAAALKRLTVPLPKIGFLQGEFERNIERMGDQHYKMATSELNIRESLINQGFDVENLSLTNTEIPKDLTALVIADPRKEFDTIVLAKIQQYITDGGNVLLAGEPGKQAILNPILQMLGVELMEGTLVQGDKDFAPDEVKSYVSATGLDFGRKISSLHQTHTQVNTRGAVGLTYVENGDFTIRPLLNTDEEMSWNKTGKLVLDSADVIYNPAAGDEKKSIPTVLALTRKVKGKEQRILVCGDADFLSNSELGKTYPKTGNGDFYQGFLGWFSYGAFPVEPSWPDPIDNKITLTGEKVNLVKWIMLGVIPGMLLTAAGVLLIRRKRQ